MDDIGLRSVVALCIAAIAGVCLWQCWIDQRQRRLITDTPTSRARGVFVGFNELVGTIASDRPLATRFTREPCVWFDYSETQEYRRPTQNNRSRTVWNVVGEDRQAIVFDVADDTGRVRVDPTGAEIIGTRITDEMFTASKGLISYQGLGGVGPTGRFRRREDALRLGDTVYVLGVAHLVDEGTRAEFRAEPGQPFFITTRGEADLMRLFRRRAALMFTLAVVAGAGAAALVAYPEDPVDAVVPVLLGAAVVAVAGAAITLTLVYNGLVRLRQRESRAWSLIEVQLNRRAVLIGRLVSCVEAYTAVEADTQERLAALRAGTWSESDHLPDDAEVDAASVEATHQSAAARSLLGLSEAYPELKADTVFAQLRAELVDSENRIALARGYFNESVTAMWDRARTFPASLLAQPMNVGTRRHFTLDGRDE
ncbi:MAG: LemA family protein [Acidimicrobiales bacterium]